MLIAQITDTHVFAKGGLAFGRLDTGQRLAAAVARLLALDPRPDVVVVTGDLVDKGTEAEYAHLRELLDPIPCPVFLIPGNHDARAGLVRVFGHHRYLPRGGGRLNYAIEDYPVRILALDTLVEGEPGGRLGGETLAWLEARLAQAPDRPTVLLMHHPPFLTGIAHMDAMNCADGPALGSLVARHPQIERILSGHVHRPISTRFAGTIAMIGPSTAFQVTLDLGPDSGATWTDEPPAFALHRWSPEAGLSSHLCYVDDFGPPRPFHAGMG